MQPDKGAMRSAFAPYTRRELVLLGVVLAAGVAARVWAVSRSAVEHFDEGVYASNVYFGDPDYAYPLQRYYAPPLLPALIEAGMIAGLPPNLAAMLPSFLAGCGTIAALWWFGRSWFGPEVGLAAAALVALNDYHITFSATALTDVLLGLWLVLAVDAIGRSLVGERPGVSRPIAPAGDKRGRERERHREADASRSPRGDYRWAIVAGIYTGLAWWTKYNGWLPLAIEAAALPVLWLLLRPPARQLQSWLGCCAITAVVAAAVWSRYYFSLQSHGGYGPIAANHAKYVVGLAGWFQSAARQIGQQYSFGQWQTAAGVVLAFALPTLLQRRAWRDWVWRLVAGLGVAIAGLCLFSVLVVSVGAAIGLLRFLVALHRTPKLDDAWNRRAIGFCLVAAWWSGMLVATPLYHPYPRLALPLMLAAWLGLAINTGDVVIETEQDFYETRLGKFWSGLSLLVVAGMLLVFALFMHRRELPSDRRGVQHIAQQIHASDPASRQRVVYVYGEPALFFQLRAAGEEIVSTVQQVPTAAATLEDKPIPTFLIAGPHAQRDPAFVRQFAAAKERWELVKEFEYRPSAVVWLDLNDPRHTLKETADLDRVRLYRLRP